MVPTVDVWLFGMKIATGSRMEWRQKYDKSTVEKLSVAQLYKLWLDEFGVSSPMEGYDEEQSEVGGSICTTDDSFSDADEYIRINESFESDNIGGELVQNYLLNEHLTSVEEENRAEHDNHSAAEFYCFEDYVPFNRLKIEERPRPRRKHRRHGNYTKSASIESNLDGKSKDFQRASTLPNIVVPKNVINECYSTTVTSEAARVHKSPVNSANISESTEKKPRKDSDGKKRNRFKWRSFSVDRLDVVKNAPDLLNREKYSRNPNLKPKGSAWNFDDDTDSCASSENMTTVSDSSSYTAPSRATSQLYYTTPPNANMVRNVERDQRWGSLTSTSSFTSRSCKGDITSFHNRHRSISMDYGEKGPMKIYTTDDIGNQSSHYFQSSPSDPALIASRASCCSSNSSLSPSRLSRSLATPPKKKGSGSDSEGSSPNKPERKRSDKRNPFGINSLFDAVEHQDMDLVKIILETNGIDINCVNSECLTPLDVAVMTNNIPMARMLLQYGAKESPSFHRHESRSSRLESLVSEAEKHVVDLTAAVLNSSAGNMSTTQQKENEKQLTDWEFRHKLLKRMKAGYDYAKKPDAPTNVNLTVSSSTSLLVRFDEPLNHNGAVVTKYKVEWSFDEDFVTTAGHSIVDDVRHMEKEIKNLTNGKCYYIRVAAWNMKGYGPFACSNPGYSVPSSWRDVDESQTRNMGKIEIFEELFRNIKTARLPHAPEIKESSECDSPQHRKRKSLKTLFTSAPKLQKLLKRGVYLASLLYNDGKVLLTAEEKLPIVEVDENYSNPSVQNEYNWMMKIACTWDDVKTLKHDFLDRHSATGSMHFRCKLLHAAQSLQNAVGLQDLGQFYHKTIKDPNGSIVLVTVNSVKDPKHATLSSGKWMSVDKLLQKACTSSTEQIDCPDPIVQSIPDMIAHHKYSSIPLPKGLYLGYVKLQCSVDQMRVLVANRSPNVFPNVKIRDCSNVSRDEWLWLKSFSSDSNQSANSNQDEFLFSIKKAAETLFENLGISWNQSCSHRFFDVEVLELSPSVSFLLIIPPVADVFIAPGQSDDLMERNGYQLLPVKVFEMMNMSTYQKKLNNIYSRLSSIAEMDLNHAQKAQREAFLDDELTMAKDRVESLTKIQQDLDRTWRSCRWVMDIISYARDKNIRGGIPLDELFMSCDKSLSSTSYFEQLFENNNSYSSCESSSCDSNEISVGKDNLKIAKFYDPSEDISNSNGHIQSDSSTGTSGILRVHAAYHTGLEKAYSVKLYVTTKTSSKEVVCLVVQTLNRILMTKTDDKTIPLYSEDQFGDFCLVAVIGSRERVLRDDYPPLQLQNPWTKGRLYVRLRNKILAAIQHGHATAV